MPGVIVCLPTCWDCKFDNCPDPPKWHSWADVDDVEPGSLSWLGDPRQQRCNCACANELD